MRRLFAFTLGVILGLAGLAAAPLFAQQQSQDSVADAARKAREKKKTEKKEGKVYTNDDLSRVPQSAAPEVQVANAPADSIAPVGGQKATPAKGALGAGTAQDEDKNSEARWRKRFKEVHDDLARAEKELDLLQREFDQGQVQYYSDPTKAMNEQLKRTQVTEKQVKIDAKKKEIEAIKQRIENMELELRRSGGDPGWAR